MMKSPTTHAPAAAQKWSRFMASAVLSVLIALTVFMVMTPEPVAAQQDEPIPEQFKDLTADQILELVRLSQALQNHDLAARLRKGRKFEPVGISMREGAITFKFANPQEFLELRMGDENSKLFLETPKGKGPVANKEYGKKIRGTDVTYEDLSMRFLYWPKPVLLREARLKFKKCWVLRVVNPDRTGPYQSVRIWVHQASGALLQMEGFGWKPSANPIKKFRVTKVQKVERTWILEQMQVESLDPKSGRSLGDTFLEIKKPERKR